MALGQEWSEVSAADRGRMGVCVPRKGRRKFPWGMLKMILAQQGLAMANVVLEPTQHDPRRQFPQGAYARGRW